MKVWSRGGNDTIDLSALGSIAAYVHGGAGNDNITGDGGNGVLVGGDGNDTAGAGAGNDMVIGGAASDRLNGSAGDDVVIGGRPRLSLTLFALRSIMAAWTTAKPVPPSSLLGPVTDTEADTMTGSSGGDWFIKSGTDKITDMINANQDAATNA